MDWKSLRQYTSKKIDKSAERDGIVFIDEEVQTGMGRSGKWWAIEHFDVIPDLIVASKALGGGMPISAVTGRADILEETPIPLLAYTHTGHAVNCAAAEAVINVIKSKKSDRTCIRKRPEAGAMVRRTF
ncbi:MAG: aminotransferase class III-fold pyridoxal phosphate-dependent enzyme [Synergistota bacterium]|nr:aminotransferase class III-fold pyridoxal phosphate-dependent enzyme [Synergistota bacterium]